MTTLQQPIGSGFGITSTADDVIRGIDLEGKVAIVTGGYSGLGRETARVLLSAGARVIVPARDVQRAAAALAAVSGVEIDAMDLLDTTSIDAFAERFVAGGQPLHFLINNAGGGLDDTIRSSTRPKNAERGASTIVWCGTSPKLEASVECIAKTTTSHRLARAHRLKPLPLQRTH